MRADPAELKVAVLCCDGPLQRELIRRAAARFRLVGVVLQQRPQKRVTLLDKLRPYRDPRRLKRQLEARLWLPREERQAEPLRQQLFPSSLQTAESLAPHLKTPAINAPEVVEALQLWAPDLVLVNGTQLLRAPVLNLIPRIPLGIINLHTGLSPYSRGGNCNLFMLLEKRPELVGLTVHHIDPGIDSGEIILSDQVKMHPDDNYEMIDLRGFDQGFNLLLHGAELLATGRAPRVRQWEHGKLFLRRTGYVYEPWHRLQAARLLRRGLVRDYLRRQAQGDATTTVRLVRAEEPES
jgi:methionyl-tRNA formyltransferase